MPRTTLALFALLCCSFGCMKPLEEQVKKDPNSNIGKTTQDIGEFKPEAGAKVSDSSIHATDPFTAPISARGPMLEKLSTLGIEHTVNLFNATEGRYPASYEEFMERIIKENNIRLPVLPGGLKYQYDVANHTLVVIEAPADGATTPTP
jgi:hypothetical protein